MDSSLVTQAAAAFGAGLLSSLSPCVYPMIPVSLGFLASQTGVHQRASILIFFVGQVLTFTTLGVLATQMGEVFGFSTELKWVNLGVGSLIIAFGVSSLFNYIPGFINQWNGLSQKLHAAEVHDYFMPLIIGIGSALLASPCTSPILGTVLLTLSQDGDFNKGLILMISYSVGLSLLFLGLGFGIFALDHLPRAGKWMVYVHKVSSVLIIFAGLYYIWRAF